MCNAKESDHKFVIVFLDFLRSFVDISSCSQYSRLVTAYCSG